MKTPVLGLVLLVMFASSVPAQDRGEAHVPIPAAPATERPMELVARRLKELQTSQVLQDVMRRNAMGGANPEALQKQLMSNPAYREILGKLSAGDPELMRMIDQLRKF